LDIKNIKYIYEFFEKREVPKIGKIKLKEYNYPILVLITCSKHNKDVQEVYYSRLIKSYNLY